MYTDKLDDIVNEYNNTHQRTIKMKPIDAKLSRYIGLVVGNNNNKDPSCWSCENIKIHKHFCKSLHFGLNWRIFCD